MGERDASGKPHGFVVEAIEAAARRAGYSVEWRAVGDVIANNQALRRGDIDIVTGFATPERRRDFYVSDPWWSSELIAIVPDASPIRADADLDGKSLAIPGGAGEEIAGHYHGSRIVPAGSAVGAVNAACSGAANAAIIATMYLRQILFTAPPACQGVSLRTLDSSLTIDLVLTARREIAPQARKLKDELDAITADGTLAAIAARHPPVSTPHATRLAELLRMRYQRRIWIISTVAGATILLFAAILLFRQSRARRRVQQSEARFRALFDAAPEAVLSVDRSGVVAFANRRSRELFGRDLVGTRLTDLVAERSRGELQRRDGPAEIAALRANGAEFPAEVRMAPVDTGERLSLAIITDISDRAAMQRQLLQSQKLESVGQLAGGVAHDFNNLLTVISGYASMALDEVGPNHRITEPLSEIVQAADRAAALTRQLLAFSRRQAATPKLLSLRELLLNLEKMLRRLIGEHIQLSISAEETAPILADPGQIEQVVVNLVVNARDAMPAGGRLTISCAMADNQVVLTVIDTGTGMAPEVEARIFEPFFTTKEQGKGTGLGLSTVYGIVKQAGGEVFVHTAIGRGSTFRVVLPAAEGSPEAPAQSVVKAGSQGQETILVAEDEPGVRRFVKEVLASNGYTVLEAATGQEALDVATRHNNRIHLLVTDLIMPEMGGVELAARMKQVDNRSAVLYMSGYTDRLLAPEIRAGLIEKPFTPAALLERVRAVLTRPHGESPPQSRF